MTTRRAFMKALGTILGGAAVPGGVVAWADDLWEPTKKIFIPPSDGGWLGPSRCFGDDFTIDKDGNIRHIAGRKGIFTPLDMHRWLQDMADDPSNDDLIDITSPSPSDRVTDHIITLNGKNNIDDEVAKFLEDGSIEQLDGKDLYSGFAAYGSALEHEDIWIEQDGKVIELPHGRDDEKMHLAKCVIKTRANGFDIDGRKVMFKTKNSVPFPATGDKAISIGALSAYPEPLFRINGWHPLDGTPFPEWPPNVV